MGKKEIVDLLIHLRQANIDAINAYDQVIPKIEDPIVKERLTVFRHNHARHIEEMNEALQSLVGPGDTLGSRDLKGFVLEGLAALRSMAGTRNALKALLPAEEMANRRYGDAISQQAPAPVHDLLRKHFSDVKIHLEYITNNLEALT